MRSSSAAFRYSGSLLAVAVVGVCVGLAVASSRGELTAAPVLQAGQDTPSAPDPMEQVRRGRVLTVSHGCG